YWEKQRQFKRLSVRYHTDRECLWPVYPFMTKWARHVTGLSVKPCNDERIGGISGCAPLVSAPDSAAHKAEPGRHLFAWGKGRSGKWACRGVNETDRHFGA